MIENQKSSAGLDADDKGTNFKFKLADVSTALEIPLFRGGLRAGFPSPADDYIGERIDLNRRLIKNPSSTFFGIVEGDSMDDVDIHDGALVIVDRSLIRIPNKIPERYKILCCLDNEFTIKFVRYDKKDKNVIWLVPANEANKKYKPIRVTSENNFIVWGVVTYTINPHIDKFE